MRVELLILPRCFKGAETLELLRSEEGSFLTRSKEEGPGSPDTGSLSLRLNRCPLGHRGGVPQSLCLLLLKLGHQPWELWGNGKSGIFCRELYPEHPMVGKSRTEDQTLPENLWIPS